MKIVIADGLVRATLSPEEQFQGIPANLGAREVGRLMGRGKQYGDGPLPALLRAVADSGDGTGLVLLRERGESSAAEGSSAEDDDVMARSAVG